MDLQSVMVGVVVTSIVAGVALVSIVGIARMTAIDAGRSTLRVLSTGMETYYTDNDQYPSSIQELADGQFVPQTFAANPNLCMAVGGGAYPQTYVAAIRVESTNDVFHVNENERSPERAVNNNTYCL